METIPQHKDLFLAIIPQGLPPLGSLNQRKVRLLPRIRQQMDNRKVDSSAKLLLHQLLQMEEGYLEDRLLQHNQVLEVAFLEELNRTHSLLEVSLDSRITRQHQLKEEGSLEELNSKNLLEDSLGVELNSKQTQLEQPEDFLVRITNNNLLGAVCLGEFSKTNNSRTKDSVVCLIRIMLDHNPSLEALTHKDK